MENDHSTHWLLSFVIATLINERHKICQAHGLNTSNPLTHGRLVGPTGRRDDILTTNVGILHEEAPELGEMMAHHLICWNVRTITIEENGKVLRVKAEQPILVTTKVVAGKIRLATTGAIRTFVRVQIHLDKPMINNDGLKTITCGTAPRSTIGESHPITDVTLESMDSGFNCRQRYQRTNLTGALEEAEGNSMEKSLTCSSIEGTKHGFSSGNEGFHGGKTGEIVDDLRIKIGLDHDSFRKLGIVRIS